MRTTAAHQGGREALEQAEKEGSVTDALIYVGFVAELTLSTAATQESHILALRGKKGDIQTS